MNKLINLPNFSAVIFDMDGLVLDTESTYFTAWQKAAIEMGYLLSDEFCLSLSGLHYQDVETKIHSHCGTTFDLKKFAELSGECWHTYVAQHGIPVKKGFFSLLEQLKARSIPYCLATNSRLSNALECLELAELDTVFSNLISRDHVKNGKPAADVFFAAAEKLNVPISQCLVLEDSKTGLLASNEAGAITVFVPSVKPVHSCTLALSKYLFNDLDEIAEIIKQSVFHTV